MKALAIQQPWASMICYGLKDVENRTWETKYRGKILIVASSKKVTKNVLLNLPIEWDQYLRNAMTYGNIPNLLDLPVSAVIGYADVVDCVKETDSLWDGGPDQIKWVLKNPYIFDEPQLIGHKAKLHLYDIPEIDENNLPPAHQVDTFFPEVIDEQLSIEVSEDVWNDLVDGDVKVLRLEDSFEISDEMFNEEDQLKEIKTIEIEYKDKKAHFKLIGTNIYFEAEQNAPDTPLKAYSILQNDLVDIHFFEFVLGERID